MSRYKKAFEAYGVDIAKVMMRDRSTNPAFSLAGNSAENDDVKALYKRVVDIINELHEDADLKNRLFADEISDEDLAQYHRPLFDAFAHITDPTSIRKNGSWKYLDWIGKACLQGEGVKSEDLYKIKSDLKDFEAFNPHMEAKDRSIDTHKTYKELLDLLRPHQVRRDQKKAEKEQRRIDPAKLEAIMQETTVIYDGPEGKIVVPHDAQASIYWGQQTRWCTAAETSRNYFDQYNRDEPLWLYMPNPNDREINAYSGYKSFKFTGTNGRLYDEQDANPSHLPPYLERLIDAAHANVSKRRSKFLEQYGSYKGYFPLVPSDCEKWGDRRAMLSAISRFVKKSKRRSDVNEAIALADPSLLQDNKFILAMWELDSIGLDDTPASFWADKAVVKKVVAKRSYFLEKASDNCRDDAGIVYKAVRDMGRSIAHASDRLKDNKRIAYAAIKEDGKALQYVSDRLKDSREIVALAINKHPSALAFASPRLRQNREFLSQAMRGGYSPSELPNKYKNEKSMILLWVAASGQNYKKVSDDFKWDKDVIRTALKTAPGLISNEGLRDNKELVVYAVSKCGASLENCAQQLRDDPEVVMAALQGDGLVLEHLPQKYRSNRDYVLAAVEQNGEALQFATPQLRSDFEVVATALTGVTHSDRKMKDVLTHASLELRLDTSVKGRAKIKNFWNALAAPGRKLSEATSAVVKDWTEEKTVTPHTPPNPQ